MRTATHVLLVVAGCTLAACGGRLSDAGDGGLEGGTGGGPDVSGFTPPPFTPPVGAHQNVCSQTFIDSFYTDCLSPNATQQSCAPWGVNADQAHKACEQCLITRSTASQWGALIEFKGLVDFNVAGCVLLLDPSNKVCAVSIAQNVACEHAACDSVCPVTDNASYQVWQQCEQAAEAIGPPCGCIQYAKPASCIDKEAQGPAKACLPQSDFKSTYDSIAPIFCGP
jgi:hypothetical protein